MIDLMNPDDLKGMTAKAIQGLSKEIPPSEYLSSALHLEKDPRAAVKSIAKTLKNKHEKYLKSVQKIENLRALEQQYRLEYGCYLAGSDEVGRGPLAGPVVCAAVIMPEKSRILHINDSKKVSAKLREELDEKIRAEAIAVEIALRTPEQIDAMNILEATKSAMAEAINALKPTPHIALIDALDIKVAMPVKGIIHGDATCYSIAAASIVAKVYRDRLMQAYHEQYPEYAFDRNMGYGTAVHMAAIKCHGLTPIHRRSFVRGLFKGLV